MFREMRRNQQLLSEETCVDILKRGTSGVLAVLGDEGYPYAVPLSYHYQGGKIYFHGAKEGHKVDAIRSCDKASFCVYDEGCRLDGDWALHIKSVIVFGRIRIVEDHRQALELTRQLSRKYTRDEAYIQKEIDSFGHELLVFCLEPEQITGKITKES